MRIGIRSRAVEAVVFDSTCLVLDTRVRGYAAGARLRVHRCRPRRPSRRGALHRHGRQTTGSCSILWFKTAAVPVTSTRCKSSAVRTVMMARSRDVLPECGTWLDEAVGRGFGIAIAVELRMMGLGTPRPGSLRSRISPRDVRGGRRSAKPPPDTDLAAVRALGCRAATQALAVEGTRSTVFVAAAKSAG